MPVKTPKPPKPVHGAKVSFKIQTPSTRIEIQEDLSAFASTRDANRYLALYLRQESLRFDPDVEQIQKAGLNRVIRAEIRDLLGAGMAFEAALTPAARKAAAKATAMDGLRFLANL